MKKALFQKVPSYVMIPNSKGEWISTGELRFYSPSLNSTIIVPEHSVNNLASIPPVFRTMFPVNGVSRPAAAVHDHLYDVQGQILTVEHGLIAITRKQADVVFKEALRATRLDYYSALPRPVRNAMADLQRDSFFIAAENQDKPLTSSFQAGIMYRAVRLGGGSYWSK